MPTNYRKSRKAYSAQKSIGKAWRNYKRRKTPLVQRTVLANRKQIKQLKGQKEVKYLANTTNNQILQGDVDEDGANSTGVPIRLNLCSGLQTGPGKNQRIGSQVTVKRITCHVKFSPPSGIAAESANRCTALLVHDKEPEGQSVLVQDLYDLTPTGSDLNTAFYSPHTVGGKNQSEKRYQVLARRTIWVGSQPNCMPEGYLTLSVRAPYKIDYGTVTDGSSHGINQTLRLFLYSDSAVAPHPRFNAQCKFSFTDA